MAGRKQRAGEPDPAGAFPEKRKGLKSGSRSARERRARSGHPKETCTARLMPDELQDKRGTSI